MESIQQNKYPAYVCDCIRNHQSIAAVQQGYQVQTRLILSVVLLPQHEKGARQISQWK